MRQAVTLEDNLAVEYVVLDQLLKWPTNPKEHDVGAIAQSMIRFGFRDPLGVNRRNHYIEEGHGRLDTLLALKNQNRQPPRFVRVDESGQWLVPVLFFDDDDLTQRGYMLAHNRTHDLGGGYDENNLLAELMEQARFGMLPGTGYDGDDVDDLRKKLEEASAPAPSQNLNVKYQIIIQCADEHQQLEMLERFQQEGIECRALIS